MARSSLSDNLPIIPETIVPETIITIDKKLGVSIFIDEDGNVTQILGEEKTREKYYPNEPSAVEIVVGDICAIGIAYEVDTDVLMACETGVSMGIGDEIYAYARYK
jgi:hypothetical protein